jgi:hypothetical protein
MLTKRLQRVEPVPPERRVPRLADGRAAGAQLLGTVEQGLAHGDLAEAGAALASARRELPRYGSDLSAQEILQLQLRYLAWEVEQAFAPRSAWRAQTELALAELARPQYTAAGQLAQIRLQLQLGLAAHGRGIRRLTPREFHLLFSCLPQAKLDAELLSLVAAWAKQTGEAELREMALSLLAQQL